MSDIQVEELNFVEIPNEVWEEFYNVPAQG